MPPLARNHSGFWIISSTFLLAGLLLVVPLPDWLVFFRPEWAALAVIYWMMAVPDKISLLVVWVVGFLIDVLEGSLLGLNAITLALVAYLTLSLYQRLRMFTAIQQSATVLILVGVHQLLAFWVLTASNQSTALNLSFMLSAFSSAIVWPFVFIGLRHLRRFFKIS